MPQRICTHICENVQIDQLQKLSILGDFDSIAVPAFPYTHPPFFIVSKWEGSKGESFDNSIRVVAPDHRTIFTTGPHSLVFQRGNPDRYIGVTKHTLNPTFDVEGQYSFDILVNGNLVHVVTLNIYRIENPEAFFGLSSI